MPLHVSDLSFSARRLFDLACSFGRRKLVLLAAVVLVQGFFQALGVSSIYPFLAVASDPAQFRESVVGGHIVTILPPMDDRDLLLWVGSGSLLLLVLGAAANLGSEVARASYSGRFTHWIRHRLLETMAYRPYAASLTANSGERLKKLLQDVETLSVLLLSLLDGTSRMITILSISAALLVVDPVIASAALATILIYYAIVYRSLVPLRRRISNAFKHANRGLSREAQQLLGGLKAVKMHGAERTFLDRFDEHSVRLARLKAIVPVLSNAPRHFIEPLAFGGVVVALMLLAARGETFVSLLPSFGVMAMAGYRILPAVQMVYTAVNTISTNQHAVEEVHCEFLSASQEAAQHDHGHFRPSAPLRWQDEIRFDRVSFRYPESRQNVLTNWSFTIPCGSSVGISGETGSGKTTLVDLLLGLHSPSQGRILVDQVPLSPDNRRAWRAGIGYVPQDIFLLDDTIAANIAFGLPPDEIENERLYEAAEAAAILDFIQNDLSDGFATQVGERGVRLSGGQRQRIGLARALYHRPGLLVLDEATSALDIATEAAVMAAIRALQASLTVVIIAHRVSTIEHCDFLLTLRRTLSPHSENKLGSIGS